MKITIQDREIELKKKYITREESDLIIISALDALKEESGIEGLDFNYLGMEEAFYDALFLICVENYDNDMKESFFNEGICEELLCNITNADYTYDMLYYLVDKMSSASNIIGTLIGKLMNESIDSNDINKLAELFPQLQDALKKYDEITGRDKK